MKRKKRKFFKLFGIGSFNPVGTGICAKLPSYCIKSASKSGFLANVTTAQTVGIGSGIGLYITGLRYFNKRYIEYRKAKIKNNVQKMNAEIDMLSREIIKKKPNITYSEARRISKSELEKRIFEDEDAEKQAKNIKSQLESGLTKKEDIPDITKIEQEAINNIVKKENIKSRDELKEFLHKKYPDMSNQKINKYVNKYYINKYF